MRMIPIFIYFYFYLFLLEFSSSLDTTINSNEYKQYLIYRRSISTFDPFTLFPGATHCEKGDPDRFIWYCAPNLLRSLAEVDGKPNIAPHWNRSSSPSCQYTITQVTEDISKFIPPDRRHRFKLSDQSSTIDGSVSSSVPVEHNEDHAPSRVSSLQPLHIRINQHSCQDNFTKVLGGSSFYALGEGLFQLNCEVADHFNNTYDVYCPHVPQHLADDPNTLQDIERLNGCMYLTLILDYEHFDAYSEYGHTLGQYHELYHLLLNRERFCFQKQNSHPVDSKSSESSSKYFLPMQLFPSPPENPLITGAYRLNISLFPHDKINLDQLWELAKEPMNYVWYWQIPETNLSSCYQFNSTIESCYPSTFNDSFNRMKFYFAGESHMRHYFDYLINQFAPDFIRPLVHKHGAITYQNYEFHLTKFAINMGNLIDAIGDGLRTMNCSEIHHETLIMFQIGTWDTAKFPLQQIFENPQAGEYLFTKLRALSRLSHSCWKMIHPIFVDTQVPMRCTQRDVKGRSHTSQKCWDRNIYTYQALNAWLEHKVKELQEFNHNFIWLKTQPMFMPRLMSVRYPCEHLLCDKGGDASIEGLIAVEAMHRQICLILQNQQSHQ